MVVISIGAVCFGLVIGWISYRTLRRNADGAAISDIASVVAAVGGGAITTLYGDGTATAFGWYAIGLLVGGVLYLLVAWRMGGKEEVKGFLGDG